MAGVAAVTAQPGRYVAAGAWLVCAGILSALMYAFGHRQYGAFDDNIIVDTAWRMFIGQKPYVDFYLPLSPEFYLGAGWAFQIWGVTWSALVRISIVMAVFTFALQSIALSYVMPRGYAIAVSLTCQMLAMTVTSYWWYNSNASITACLLFSASCALAASPRAKTPAAIFCIAVVMLGLMKVNIAALSITAVCVPLLTVRRLRRNLVVWLAGSAAGVLLILTVNGLDPFEILQAYLKMAGTRGRPSLGNFLRGKPNEAFVCLPLLGASLAAFVVACSQLLRTPRADRPGELPHVLSIALAGILVGLLFIFMSTEQTLISGLPLIFLSASSLILWALNRNALAAHVPFALTLALMMCAAATGVGIALFDRLPFDTLVGRIGFDQANRSLLMVWSFLAVMGAVTFVAGTAFVPLWHRFSYAVGSGTWIWRHVLLVVAPAVLASASVACWFGIERLEDVVAARTVFRTLPLFVLLGLWSISAVIGVVVLAAIGRQTPSARSGVTGRLARWPVIVVVLIVTTAAAATYVGGRRLRVRGNGPEVFYSERTPVAVARPFFRGFPVSPGLKAVVEEIETVLRDYQAQGYDTSKVFFGIRLEFAYAAFGIPSPVQLPVWWDPEAAYPPSDETAIVERFAAHRFPLCILYGNAPDFSNLPRGIQNELSDSYRQISYSSVTVFVRNP